MPSIRRSTLFLSIFTIFLKFANGFTMEDCEESFGECQAIKDDFAEILDDDVEHLKGVFLM